MKRRLRLRLVAGQPRVARGSYRGHQVTAVLAGVGGAAAAAAARDLVAQGCDLLVSLGFAGGLDPSLSPGAARGVSQVLGPDGELRLPTRGSSLPQARLVSVALAAGSVEQKAALRLRCGADLVDMETHAVACVADECRLPWLGVRAVSDGARDSLPDLVQRHVRPDLGRVRTGHIVLGALVRPGSWPGLIGLGVRSTRAGNALAIAVAQVLEEL